MFAHNGDLPGIDLERQDSRRFRPMGETDSERAFCLLLTRLAPLWAADAEPSLHERTSVVREFAANLRSLGPANFIYTDGAALFAHGDRRRNRPREPMRPPGLHVLARRCRNDAESVTGGGLGVTTSDVEHVVVIVASVPLTEEAWSPLAPGELIVTAGGELVNHETTP